MEGINLVEKNHRLSVILCTPHVSYDLLVFLASMVVPLVMKKWTAPFLYEASLLTPRPSPHSSLHWIVNFVSNEHRKGKPFTVDKLCALSRAIVYFFFVFLFFL